MNGIIILKYLVYHSFYEFSIDYSEGEMNQNYNYLKNFYQFFNVPKKKHY
jgi:hypothetical protein